MIATYVGDGGTYTTDTNLNTPRGVWGDKDGNLFIGEFDGE